MQRGEHARQRRVPAAWAPALLLLAVAGFALGWVTSHFALAPARESTVGGGAVRALTAVGTAAPVPCAALDTARSGVVGTTVPVLLTRVSGGEVAVVEVCIGGHGPYSFVIDTGSPRSAIDARLAASLHLGAKGTVAVGGSGCATSGRTVAVPALRVGPLRLDAQAMVRASLAGWSGRHFDGVLGSDVWGRFGVVRVDLTQRTLSVASGEGPDPTGHSVVVGRSSSPPPPGLSLSGPTRSTPINVVLAPESISPFVQGMVAGHGPYAFALDTGSPTSSLSATVGFTLHLPDQGSAEAPGGIGCRGIVPTLVPTPGAVTETGVASASGSLGRTLALRATVLPGPSAPGPARSGMVGSLGLDVLGADGALVVDYKDGTLTTGAG